MSIEKIDEETIIITNQLFAKIFGLFPSIYGLIKSQSQLDSMKREWINGLVNTGLIGENGFFHKERLFQGIQSLHFLDQVDPPSFGQFISLCNKSDLNNDLLND